MRKIQKKRALDQVRTLHETHNRIKDLIEKKDANHSMDLLERCQQEAIQLGNLIEETEGEEASTVRLLELYCEDIYQIYERIQYGEAINSGKIYKLLRKQLIQIENSIKNDLKERIEAVFLPYKASMWDSLESVWKAADEDEDCDAYVIPIPYYDKNPDGSFREEHWEGDQYPAYVPITKYSEYDFAARRPDMIFIHNPYDECNYVTSVHPFFFSSNLKRFTDKLIYIPYFLIDEISPDHPSDVEGIKHFCTVPGVRNADKVIVQSEDMRQIYINIVTKFSGGNTRGYWEKKISGLGSPKVDKVLNTEREELEIPEEWKGIIQKPDGSWKKIVFYNTSISALLEHGSQMLRKMRDVFSIFKENQEEVTLLWRPHPLLRATIASMRPMLWQEYERLVQEYREGGWGIYDDTADIDRAVCVSDVYFGDPSSVVWLFQKTKKIVMIQDVRVLEGEEDREKREIL